MDLTTSSILPIDETCGHHTTLTDLPNELLCVICHLRTDGEDIDELLSLASVCTQLHSITLPMYFARLGFGGSSLRLGYLGLSLAVHASKILKGIRLLFPPFLHNSLTTLECRFKCVSIESTYDDCIGVMELLHHTPIVSDVHLWFRPPSGQVRFALGPEFYSMLMALGKKSCKSLHIVNLPSGYECFPKFEPGNTLETISISCNSLRYEAMEWIVPSINNSPLRTLELNIKKQRYTLNLLSQLEVPHLTDLNIYSQIPINEIMLFLSRHPGIIRLHVAVDKDLPQKVDTYALTHLTFLAAAPAVVAMLLSQPGRAPNLNNIHLFTDASGDAIECWETVYSDNDEMELTQSFAVLQSYPNISNLSLTLFKRLGSTEWVTGLGKASINGLRHIRLFKVYSEPRLIDLIPNFIQSLHSFIPVLFPYLGILTVDVPETTVVEKQPIVRQLRAVCPTLSEISFSRDVPTSSVTLYV